MRDCPRYIHRLENTTLMRVHLTLFPKCPLNGTCASSMSPGISNTNRAGVILQQMYKRPRGCKFSFQFPVRQVTDLLETTFAAGFTGQMQMNAQQ